MDIKWLSWGIWNVMWQFTSRLIDVFETLIERLHKTSYIIPYHLFSAVTKEEEMIGLCALEIKFLYTAQFLCWLLYLKIYSNKMAT